MNVKLVILLSIFILIISSAFYAEKIMAPVSFPAQSIYTIEKGEGLSYLASDLKDKSVIKSEFWFKVFSVVFGGTKGVIAGDYFLDQSQNVIFIAKKINSGDFDLTPVSVTIPEGLNIFEVSEILELKLLKINSEEFVNAASTSEGYLFPDTYLFSPTISTPEIIEIMKNNFQTKLSSLNNEILNSGYDLSDIVKVASILELEARTTETRKVIADILWRRLELGMPLQVDVSFKYINGKTTKDLSLTDLKLNSPYNSYLYKGLPPTPISNPGLDSIKAAISPTKTSYLYFLSDDNGNMYYAKTFSEHLQNKQMYLK